MTHPRSILIRSLLMAVVAAGLTASPALAKSKHASTARKGPIPELISPADDARVPAGKTVVFTWQSSAKVVRIEVARDSAFTDIAVSTAVRGKNAGLKLAEGSYYWRLSVPKGTPSEPRKLTVGEPPAPEPLTAAPPQATPAPEAAAPGPSGSPSGPTATAPQPKAQPQTSEGLGLDLSGSTSSSATSTTPSGTAPSTESTPAPETETAPSAAATAESEQAPAEGEHARAEHAVENPWHVFVGGNGAISFGGTSTASLRYEGGVAYRLLPALELSLAVGGAEVTPIGTRDATWPTFTWLGQIYADLSARYRLTKLGPGPLYGIASIRLPFFTAPETDRGFLQNRSPFAPGVGVGYRFRAGLPIEVDLRFNLLTGSSVAGELELGVRVFVF